jgi:hypothetical protein
LGDYEKSFLNEDTFLADAAVRLPDSILNICCETHKAPSIFFSN